VHIRRRFNAIFCVIIILVAWMGFSDAREKTGAAKKITATYIKSEIGDYNHAIFQDSAGQEISFWCSAKMIDFLDRHQGKPMEITYTMKEVFIPEANKKMPIEVINKVTVGGREFREAAN
jgi:hypothetical protein